MLNLTLEFDFYILQRYYLLQGLKNGYRPTGIITALKEVKLYPYGKALQPITSCIIIYGYAFYYKSSERDYCK